MEKFPFDVANQVNVKDGVTQNGLWTTFIP